ncbi:unnamed protein product [Didymodactylos carnosus]|uniref:Uncharacterized protein n=1 Tax=Didymodactylos carnosus TaxID=1234261 RepID=A0A8S2IUV8_9BILA|nr:unnamed protein product [Didymodactylos carnosus]CAF3770159.1 unnamed protein product [Didymodactylos carnosus]
MKSEYVTWECSLDPIRESGKYKRKEFEKGPVHELQEYIPQASFEVRSNCTQSKSRFGSNLINTVKEMLPFTQSKKLRKSRSDLSGDATKRLIRINIQNYIDVDPELADPNFTQITITTVLDILDTLGDKYDRSKLEKEIKQQINFFRNECAKTKKKSHHATKYCWKNTLALVFDVEKNENVDKQRKDWLNPNFEHSLPVPFANVASTTSTTTTGTIATSPGSLKEEDAFNIHFNVHPTYIQVFMPSIITSYMFNGNEEIIAVRFKRLKQIIFDFLNNRQLVEEYDENVERIVKVRLRQAFYAAIIAKLSDTSKATKNPIISCFIPNKSIVSSTITTRLQKRAEMHLNRDYAVTTHPGDEIIDDMITRPSLHDDPERTQTTGIQLTTAQQLRTMTTMTPFLRAVSLEPDKYDIIEEWNFDKEEKILRREENLLANKYYSEFLLWKLQYTVSHRAYEKVSQQCRILKAMPPPLHKLNLLTQFYEKNLFITSTEHGVYFHVRRAILMLVYSNYDLFKAILNSGARTLTFRLCEDGTWIGKNLTCVVSSLGWIDLGVKGQAANNLIPIAIVKIPKETRMNLQEYLTKSYVDMFARDQVIVLDGTEFNIRFCYSADYKMVSQIMGLGGVHSPYQCNWCKYLKMGLNYYRTDEEEEEYRMKNDSSTVEEIDENVEDGDGLIQPRKSQRGRKKTTTRSRSSSSQRGRGRATSTGTTTSEPIKSKLEAIPKIAKITREDVFKRWSAYDVDRGARTLEEHLEEIGHAYPKYGYVDKPIYGRNFDYKDIVVDLLHMKLRICDALLKHAIKIASEVGEDGTHDDIKKQTNDALIYFEKFKELQRAGMRFKIEANLIVVVGSVNGMKHERFTKQLRLTDIAKNQQRASKWMKLTSDFFHILDMLKKTTIENFIMMQ